LPFGIRSFFASRDGNSRIGAEDINHAEILNGLFDHTNHVGFHSDIRSDKKAADVIRQLLTVRFVEIRDHHAAGTFRGESLAQRAADPVGAAGHNHHFVSQLHNGSPLGL
jgi:hypothetical protein